jgi:hypothetical protein
MAGRRHRYNAVEPVVGGDPVDGVGTESDGVTAPGQSRTVTYRIRIKQSDPKAGWGFSAAAYLTKGRTSFSAVGTAQQWVPLHVKTQ